MKNNIMRIHFSHFSCREVQT